MIWNRIKNSGAYIKMKSFFKQGLSPRQLALTIIISILIGVMPVLIVNTWIIGVFSVVFRLNLPLALLSITEYGHYMYYSLYHL
ncbi:MAG: DUF2062 domain-containing protein [Saprospiraceae bacterium]|nr:DUF2062 domain-containing protein [Saprospiraceae bacterium]